MSVRNRTGDDENFINLLLHHQCDSIFSQHSDIDIHDFLSSHPCSIVVCSLWREIRRWCEIRFSCVPKVVALVRTSTLNPVTSNPDSRHLQVWCWCVDLVTSECRWIQVEKWVRHTQWTIVFEKCHLHIYEFGTLWTPYWSKSPSEGKSSPRWFSSIFVQHCLHPIH